MSCRKSCGCKGHSHHGCHSPCSSSSSSSCSSSSSSNGYCCGYSSDCNCTGPTGPTGPQGPTGPTGTLITSFAETLNPTGAVLGTPPANLVLNSAGTVLTNGAYTLNSPTNTLLTIPAAGVYQLNLSLEYTLTNAATAGTAYDVIFHLEVNGSAVAYLQDLQTVAVPASAIIARTLSTSIIVGLSAGNTIDVLAASATITGSTVAGLAYADLILEVIKIA